jgi:hypothetical protein
VASVRLHHPTFTNCNYVIELQKPYEVPHDCPTCKVQHFNKSIHLRLDSEGDVIVTEGVYEMLLREVGLAGMTAENRVDKPPPMRIGAVEVPTQEIRLSDRRFYVPGRNKYESGNLMEKSFRKLLGKEKS